MIKPQIDKIKSRLSKNATNAEIERGTGILSSLRIVTNVLYALMIFEIFKLLPFPSDPNFDYIRLRDVFAENQSRIFILGIGLFFIIIYWIQGNLQFGNLKRSSSMHALFAMGQMIALMLYIYFVLFEISFTESVLALRMQSSLLCIAGVFGAFNWRYARFRKFTTDKIDDAEEMDLFYKILPEPITAFGTIFFAGLGTTYWSLSWLLIIPIGFIVNFLRRKIRLSYFSN